MTFFLTATGIVFWVALAVLAAYCVAIKCIDRGYRLTSLEKRIQKLESLPAEPQTPTPEGGPPL